MKKYYLAPVYDRAKSFYYKATVIEAGSNSTLFSYDTAVLRIAGGSVERLWNGYSLTTLRHVNEFLAQAGRETLSKMEWEKLPVVNL